MTRRCWGETTLAHAFRGRRVRGWGVARLALPCARVAVAVLLLAGASGLLSHIGETRSSFSDVEQSAGNTLRAGALDVQLDVQGSTMGWVGAEPAGALAFGISVVVAPESAADVPATLVWQEDVALSDPAACAALALEVSRNGAASTTHTLASASTTLSVFAQGGWSVAVGASFPGSLPVAHGARCAGALHVRARRGFSDEEVVPLDVKVRTVVLNEALPHPDPTAEAPNDREWVELINIGNQPVDIAGWRLSEMTASGNEVFHSITPLSAGASGGNLVPVLGTTLIPPGGTVVLAFAGDRHYFNNSGDTLRLYDAAGELLDKVAYTVADAPQGKSIARLPDGIGGWWDPAPTPGLPNQPTPHDAPLRAAHALVVPHAEEEAALFIDEVTQQPATTPQNDQAASPLSPVATTSPTTTHATARSPAAREPSSHTPPSPHPTPLLHPTTTPSATSSSALAEEGVSAEAASDLDQLQASTTPPLSAQGDTPPAEHTSPPGETLPPPLPADTQEGPPPSRHSERAPPAVPSGSRQRSEVSEVPHDEELQQHPPPAPSSPPFVESGREEEAPLEALPAGEM